MANIKIDKEVGNRAEAADDLRHIATQIEQGYWAGEGWDYEDEEEEEED